MQMKAVYCFLVFLVGCAQFAPVPKPSMYPYTLQQHMQAAHHWDVLAKQIAGKVATNFKHEYVPSIAPVYVRNHDDRSPFDKAFRSFLITELINQGIWVSSQGVNSVSVNQDNRREVNWEVQIVVHNAHRINPSFFGLSWDVRRQTMDGPLPYSEVIITTTMTDDGPIWLRDSTVFYINDQDKQHYDKDWQHYWSRPDAPQKTYAAVGCPPRDVCPDQ